MEVTIEPAVEEHKDGKTMEEELNRAIKAKEAVWLAEEMEREEAYKDALEKEESAMEIKAHTKETKETDKEDGAYEEAL
eukprot:12212559-Ditylum_brightwellii.AAC.1